MPKQWWDRKRVAVYTGAILLMQLVLLAIGMGRADIAMTDFRIFWAGARLALQGQAAAVYDPQALFAAMQLATSGALQPNPVFRWFYPPSFLCLVMPLGALPLMVAYALWTAAGVAAVVVVLRRMLPQGGFLLPLLAFFPFFHTVVVGQNALLTAACACCGMLLMERRSWLAACCFAALSVKPHLFIVLPLLLACAGKWRLLLQTLAVAAAINLLALAMLGPDLLPGFLHNLAAARQLAESGDLPATRMPTVFAMLRMAGVGPGLALLQHGAVGVLAIGIASVVWRKNDALGLKAAAFMFATLMVSPHMFEYDLTWFGMALAWLASHCLRRGWPRGLPTAMALAWICPLLGEIFSLLLHVQLMPLVVFAMLLVTLGLHNGGRQAGFQRAPDQQAQVGRADANSRNRKGAAVRTRTGDRPARSRAARTAPPPA
jgi:hypothetical protein